MKLKLVERKQETVDVESFILEPQESLSWKAGQYLHYVLHHEPTDDRGSDRWFTISAAPSEKHVMLTTRFNVEKSSSFKKKLQSLQVGKSIEITHVSGDFIVDDLSKAYVFIAGGIGITPFRSILKELSLTKQAIMVTLLYANRDSNIVFKEELEEFAKENPQIKIHYILSPQHIDEEGIKQYVENIEDKVFYISGPEPMVDAIANMLKGMGVTEEHIKGDWFPGYPQEYVK